MNEVRKICKIVLINEKLRLYEVKFYEIVGEMVRIRLRKLCKIILINKQIPEINMRNGVNLLSPIYKRVFHPLGSIMGSSIHPSTNNGNKSSPTTIYGMTRDPCTGEFGRFRVVVVSHNVTLGQFNSRIGHQYHRTGVISRRARERRFVPLPRPIHPADSPTCFHHLESSRNTKREGRPTLK